MIHNMIFLFFADKKKTWFFWKISESQKPFRNHMLDFKFVPPPPRVYEGDVTHVSNCVCWRSYGKMIQSSWGCHLVPRASLQPHIFVKPKIKCMDSQHMCDGERLEVRGAAWTLNNLSFLGILTRPKRKFLGPNINPP